MILRREVTKGGKPAGIADYGPAERWQHSGRLLLETEHAGVMAARALEESIVDVLALKGVISSTQREAALRFKLDFHVAGMEARMAGSYSSVRTQFSPFGPWDERNEIEEAAYGRWRNAVRNIGLLYSDAVITVVCHERLCAAERVGALLKGLERLVKWYGLREEN